MQVQTDPTVVNNTSWGLPSFVKAIGRRWCQGVVGKLDCAALLGVETLLGLSATLAVIGTLRVTEETIAIFSSDSPEGKSAIGHVGEWPSQALVNAVAMALVFHTFIDRAANGSGSDPATFGLQPQKGWQGIKIEWKRGGLLTKAKVLGYTTVAPLAILATGGLQVLGSWYSSTGEEGRTPQIGHGGEWLGQGLLSIYVIKQIANRFVKIANSSRAASSSDIESKGGQRRCREPSSSSYFGSSSYSVTVSS